MARARSTRRSRRTALFAAAAAAGIGAGVVVPAARPARGALLFWDGGTSNIPNNGTGGFGVGGSGTWSTSIANWDMGSTNTHVPWLSSYDAYFSGAPGTVTLGSSIVANSVDDFGGDTFNTGTYPLTIGAGGVVDASMFGASPTTTINGSATVGLTLSAAQVWTAASNANALYVNAPVHNGGNTLTLNGSGGVTISGVVSGSGGLVVNGTATLAGYNTYTGPTTVNAGGALAIVAPGIESSGATGTITNAGTLTLVPNTFQLVLPANVTSTGTLVAYGNGLGDDYAELQGTATLSGTVTVAGTTLSLGQGATLTAAVQFAGGRGVLALGGTSQTIASLSATADTTPATSQVIAGSLALNNMVPEFAYAPDNAFGTSSLDLSGLTSFSFVPLEGQYFKVAVGRDGAAAANTTVTLAAANTIATDFLGVGFHYDPTADGGTGSASGPAGVGTLNLGTTNAIYASAIQLGGYQTSGGVVQFGQYAGAGATLTLRNTGGHVSAVQGLFVGNQQSATVPQASTFDVSAGALNAIVNNLTVSYVDTTTPAATESGTFKMAAGTLNAGTIRVGYTSQAGVGSTTNTATVVQAGGGVLAGLVEFAALDSGASPALTNVGTYTLGTPTASALLSAAQIGLGSYAAATTSTATLNFVNGTITNYDDTANGFAGQGAADGGDDVRSLTIAGAAGGGAAGDSRTLQVNLVGTAAHHLTAEGGRTITVAATALFAGPGGLTVDGPGGVYLYGANTYAGPTTVSNGLLDLQPGGSIAGPLTVNGTGAAEFTAAQLGGLSKSTGPVTIADAGIVALLPSSTSATRTLLTAPSLAITGTGRFDLYDNDLRLTGTTVSAATALAAAGFAGGAWDGPGGLTSSTAMADAAHLTGVGVILNGSTYATFDGQPAAATDVLVRYTYYGDTNLDGVVNAADYTRVDAGYVGHLTGWQNGDFNYDGVVDGTDYALMDNAFDRQGGVAAPAAVAAVPEAAALGPLCVAGLSARRPRRRRR